MILRGSNLGSPEPPRCSQAISRTPWSTFLYALVVVSDPSVRRTAPQRKKVCEPHGDLCTGKVLGFLPANHYVRLRLYDLVSHPLWEVRAGQMMLERSPLVQSALLQDPILEVFDAQLQLCPGSELPMRTAHSKGERPTRRSERTTPTAHFALRSHFGPPMRLVLPPCLGSSSSCPPSPSTASASRSRTPGSTRRARRRRC